MNYKMLNTIDNKAKAESIPIYSTQVGTQMRDTND